MARQHSCPMCGGNGDPAFAAVDENRRISADAFAYLRCQGCGTLFLRDIPDDLGRYYASDYYAIPTPERLDALANGDQKIHIVKQFAAGGRLLEVGPAFGVFAWRAKRDGFTVDVIEMDERCCAFLRARGLASVQQSNMPHEAIGTTPPHDVIAAWHVMEHLPQPLAFLEAAASNLAAGGHLILAMPNPQARQFGWMGRRWPHVDAPRHINLIPASALESAAAKLGLRRVFLTTSDPDGRNWNRFGWQRLLMNRFAARMAQRVMFILGTLLSLPFALIERGGLNGAAYTIVLRKGASE